MSANKETYMALSMPEQIKLQKQLKDMRKHNAAYELVFQAAKDLINSNTVMETVNGEKNVYQQNLQDAVNKATLSKSV